jgi:hypothetical protein
MGNELADLSKQWDDNMKSKHRNDTTINHVLAELPSLIEKLFLRFTADGRFLKWRVVQVPLNIYQEFVCEHPGHWNDVANRVSNDLLRDRAQRREERRQDWIAKGKDPKDFKLGSAAENVYYRARCIATFPFLAELRDEDDEPLQLTAIEWMDHAKRKNVGDGKWILGNAKYDPYMKNLKAIVESSGKVAKIKELLEGRFNPKNFLDATKQPSRHIFITSFWVVNHIMDLVGCLLSFACHD